MIKNPSEPPDRRWVAQVDPLDAEPIQPDVSQDNPLVANQDQKVVYIGIVILILTVINVLGLFSQRFKRAVKFSLLFSVGLIVALWFLF
ncbi:hypothetical protein [Lyngbya sp. CCY1209]|uniref:hypothetical protein n=1 Tax=Lyngbya sp. CCY1209 TaxID=2886103 RepID=UPI002D20ACEE|nr:hypothetical protein [Lyngbya sp. CCY1209]MEB3886192.1 hypothetical protein [Lyngbya sp. CCY1209]